MFVRHVCVPGLTRKPSLGLIGVALVVSSIASHTLHRGKIVSHVSDARASTGGVTVGGNPWQMFTLWKTEVAARTDRVPLITSLHQLAPL